LRALRHGLFRLLTGPQQAAARSALFPAARCALHLPVRIGDYTDFYAGIHHAMNVGSLFRPENPLLPNYKYVPIGYHGRVSSVRVSGTNVVRPNGQTRAGNASAPAFGPSKRLDYELEMAIWEALFRSARRRITSLDCLFSTIGPPGISRHGNISRSARSSPRISIAAFHPGS
jgi:fumarylacetoacetase